eukprot:m.206135 g.206135  ORF g.206135 m.206135 type:complete len:550 (-) comp25341_c0_seq2:391-2040(-)
MIFISTGKPNERGWDSICDSRSCLVGIVAVTALPRVVHPAIRRHEVRRWPAKPVRWHGRWTAHAIAGGHCKGHARHPGHPHRKPPVHPRHLSLHHHARWWSAVRWPIPSRVAVAAGRKLLHDDCTAVFHLALIARECDLSVGHAWSRRLWDSHLAACRLLQHAERRPLLSNDHPHIFVGTLHHKLHLTRARSRGGLVRARPSLGDVAELVRDHGFARLDLYLPTSDLNFAVVNTWLGRFRDMDPTVGCFLEGSMCRPALSNKQPHLVVGALDHPGDFGAAGHVWDARQCRPVGPGVGASIGVVTLFAALVTRDLVQIAVAGARWPASVRWKTLRTCHRPVRPSSLHRNFPRWVRPLAGWAVRAKSGEVFWAQYLTGMPVLTRDAVTTKTASIPGALNLSLLRVDVEKDALVVVALLVRREEEALGHARQIVAVKKVALISLFTETPQPMLAHLVLLAQGVAIGAKRLAVTPSSLLKILAQIFARLVHVGEGKIPIDRLLIEDLFDRVHGCCVVVRPGMRWAYPAIALHHRDDVNALGRTEQNTVKAGCQ